MKRSFFRLSLIFAALALLASCDENVNVNPGVGEENIDEFGNVPYTGDDIDCYEFDLNASEGDFKATDNGVSIKIDQVQESNVVFSLVPGPSVVSYRMDIYPKAILYNMLLESGYVDKSADDIEDCIMSLLTASTGSAGYIINADSFDDYDNHQYDLMNSKYPQYKLVPDCDYFITILACYDSEGQSPAFLSMSHVRTGVRECVGNPQIALDVDLGYRSYMIKYLPNTDCKYFYEWNYLTEELDEYIDIFGERMMRDFMRSAVSSAIDASVEDNLFSRVSFDQPDPSLSYTAVAVALDANQMPAENIARIDFNLKEAPEDAETPKATMTVNENRLGATVAWLKITLEKTAMSAFLNVVPKATAESYKQADSTTRAALALELAQEGWGVANKNYTFDPESQKPTGNSFYTESEFWTELAPDREYEIVYVAKNFFGHLSDLCFSEPFRTKPLVVDNPENCSCNSSFVFECRNVSREGWTYYIDYNWDDIALYRFQIVAPGVVDGYSPYIDEFNTGSREDWINFFYYDVDGYGVSKCNTWWPMPSGNEEFSVFGYTSGVQYVIAYCVEDMNGVVGPIQFTTVETRKVVPGPNPTMKIEASISEDGQTLNCKFISNEDSKQIKFFGSSEGSYQNLGLHKLIEDRRGEYEYEDYMRIWKNYAVELGLQSGNTSAVSSYEIDPASDEFLLIGAIAIGENNGEDCYSDFAYVLYYKGEFHELSEYRTPAN